MRAILRDVVVCVLVGGIGSGGAAHAQTTPTQTTASQNTAAQPDSANPDKSGTDSKKTTAAKDAPTTVVVTGKKPGNHIDRQVYDVTKNPDALTGTAAEALNKVPGVTVDPSGNVTLRGRNVRIFLNGRPSLMLSGDNRGVALRAMPSSYLSSVEVISNPGSQYGSGSSDPIINIVTKRKLPPGLFGSASARLNSTGRGQANIYSTLAAGELNLTGFSVYYGDRQPSTSGFNLQGFDATSGLGTNTTQSNSLSLVHSNGVFDSLSAEYNLSPDDVLNVGSTYNKGTGDWSGRGNTAIYAASGTATDLNRSNSLGQFLYQSQGFTFGYMHYGKKPDETLKIDGSVSQSKNTGQSRNEVDYTLSTVAVNRGTRVDTKSNIGDNRRLILNADYNTPMGDDQLALGAQIDSDTNHSRNLSFGPDDLGAAPTPQPLFDDDFRFEQNVAAAYGTYQREFTDALTVLGGLRAEATDLTLNDMTGQVRSHTHYARINPSVFATYVLSSTQKLRLNYVRHQQRPQASDLNPHLIFNSSSSVTLGNSDLRPQENDTMEGAYEYDRDGLSYALRAFYRRDDHLITSKSFFIPDPQGEGNQVLETTRMNFGHQTANGLTGTYNNRIGGKLTLSADATLTFSTTRNPNITGEQRGTSLGGGASISYIFANKDQLFISDKVTGKTYSGQGYTTSYSMATLQYNHMLTRNLNFVMSISDPFRTAKSENVTATPLIHSVSMTSRTAPTFYISLTRNFSLMPKLPAAK